MAWWVALKKLREELKYAPAVVIAWNDDRWHRELLQRRSNLSNRSAAVVNQITDEEKRIVIRRIKKRYVMMVEMQMHVANDSELKWCCHT